MKVTLSIIAEVVAVMSSKFVEVSLVDIFIQNNFSGHVWRSILVS